jgi:hypothetical protein
MIFGDVYPMYVAKAERKSRTKAEVDEIIRWLTGYGISIFDIILGIFIAILLISNIASSAKIVDLGFSIFNIPMAFDAGTK